MRPVCMDASPKTKEEQGKRQGSLENMLWSWTEGGLIASRFALSASQPPPKWFSPAGREYLSHSCPVEIPLCITGIGPHTPCYALVLAVTVPRSPGLGMDMVEEIFMSPVAGHLSSS